MNRKVVEYDGIRYVVEPVKIGGKLEQKIISRWLSKKVYLSLMETFDSNNVRMYDKIMSAKTLKEARGLMK